MIEYYKLTLKAHTPGGKTVKRSYKIHGFEVDKIALMLDKLVDDIKDGSPKESEEWHIDLDHISSMIMDVPSIFPGGVIPSLKVRELIVWLASFSSFNDVVECVPEQFEEVE